MNQLWSNYLISTLVYHNCDLTYTSSCMYLVSCSHVGLLGTVRDVSVNLSNSSLIHLNWRKPFTLNLTTAEPDVVYCVGIFKIADLELSSDHLVSNCSVFEPQYNFSLTHPDPRTLMQVVVTPRSNVEGARNGTPKSIYLFESELSRKLDLCPLTTIH